MELQDNKTIKAHLNTIKLLQYIKGILYHSQSIIWHHFKNPLKIFKVIIIGIHRKIMRNWVIYYMQRDLI